MRKTTLLSLFIMIGLTGCFNPNSQVTIPTANLSLVQKSKLQMNVGYYISEYNRNLITTTQAGGGNTISYFLYKDLEPAINYALMNNFEKVYFVNNIDNKSYLDNKNIKYILIPAIKTNSYSPSAMYWPPQTFNIELEYSVYDISMIKLFDGKIFAQGIASEEEWKQNGFMYASQRAVETVYNKLSLELKNKFGDLK